MKIYTKHGDAGMTTLKSATQISKADDRIAALGWLEHVIFISFLWEDLVHVRRILPNQKCQFLFGGNTQSDELLERMRQYRFDVDIAYRDLNEEWIKKYHDAGMEINCWTVDDPDDAERLAAWGVDYITSNILE